MATHEIKIVPVNSTFYCVPNNIYVYKNDTLNFNAPDGHTIQNISLLEKSSYFAGNPTVPITVNSKTWSIVVTEEISPSKNSESAEVKLKLDNDSNEVSLNFNIIPALKNVFLQVDTNSVMVGALALKSLLDQEVIGTDQYKKQLNELYLQHTLIYQSGAMSLGTSVANFLIGANEGDRIFFTLLPLQLFSTHRLVFNYNCAASLHQSPISNTDKTIASDDFTLINATNIQSPFSFGIEITKNFTGQKSFSLNGILQIEGLSPITICIDPKMKIDPQE